MREVQPWLFDDGVRMHPHQFVAAKPGKAGACDRHVIHSTKSTPTHPKVVSDVELDRLVWFYIKSKNTMKGSFFSLDLAVIIIVKES